MAGNIFPLPPPSDDLTPIPADYLGKPPPPRRFMVEDCFGEGTVGMISGDGGVGKSLLALQLCACAAMGRAWLNLAVRPGRALYFACEDDTEELHRRLWSIARHLGYSPNDILEGGLEMHGRVEKPDNVLCWYDRASDSMAPTLLMGKLALRCKREGISYVVLDTATDVFEGNQNNDQHVKQFITHLRRLAMAINGLVILTKHPSLTGRNTGTGESGSVQWSNRVRSRMYLYTEKNTGNRVLELMKSNYSPKGRKIYLEWDAGAFRERESAAFDGSSWAYRD